MTEVLGFDSAMGSELRQAIRRLTSEPALAAAAIASLALGIGACTAMVSIVEAVLLKPMDVARPQRLVVMWPQFGDTAGEFTYNAYRELSRRSASFERVALTGSTNWPVPIDILLPPTAAARAPLSARFPTRSLTYSGRDRSWDARFRPATIDQARRR